MAGLNGSASITHQIKIAFLSTNINNFLFLSKKQKFKNVVSTTETKFEYILNKVTFRKESDILVFDYLDFTKIYIWIEISKKNMVAADKKKIDLIFKKNTNVKEGFVFDYENNIWYKRTKNSSFIESDNSAFLLNKKLSDFVNSINVDLF